MLLIVIDKGRFGDTFPQPFAFYDLRPRYQQTDDSHTWASIVQDIGRAFGYGKRPQVFVSARLWEALSKKQGIRPHETLQKKPRVSVMKAMILVDDCDVDPNPPAAAAAAGGSNGSEPAAAGSADLDEDDIRQYWELSKDHPEHAVHGGVALNNERRFLLWAHPQNGKTGAFIQVIRRLLTDLYGADVAAALQRYDSNQSFRKQLYALRNQAAPQLHQTVLDVGPAGREQWVKFHQAAETNYSHWASSNRTIPWKYAERMIAAYIAANRLPAASAIVDMGCGTAHLAAALTVGAATHAVTVTSVDHMRHPDIVDAILVHEANMSATNLPVASFDAVVFSLSLWGEPNDIQSYLEEAFRLLKPKGWIFIVEANGNYMPRSSQRMHSKLTELLSAAKFNSVGKRHENQLCAIYAQKPEVVLADVPF